MKALSIETAGHPPQCLTAQNMNCGVVAMAWNALCEIDDACRLQGMAACPKCGLLVEATGYPKRKAALQ